MNHSVPNDSAEHVVGHLQEEARVGDLAARGDLIDCALLIDVRGDVDGVGELGLGRAERVAVVGGALGVEVVGERALGALSSAASHDAAR